MATTGNVKRELDELRKEIAALRADAKRMKKHAGAAATAGVSSADAIKENLVDRVSEMKDTLVEGANDALDEIADQVDKLRETVSDYSKTAGNGVKAHPWIAIGGAVGIGLLIGRLKR